MANLIDRVFAGNGLKLMTHIVAGYPDIESSERLIEVMVENGSDLVEIQIPFTDPLADGPTIALAGQEALDKGVTPEDCFELAERLSKKVDIPLLIMTYCNIPFSMGMEEFVCRCARSGVSGLIIPDMPFDEDNGHYLEITKEYGVYPIPVVSPGMERRRLQEVVDSAEGFVYTTLRVGITGARRSIDDKGLSFLRTLRECTSLPVAAGFGISSPGMVGQLEGNADAAIIGSRVIDIFNREGINAVGRFIRDCKSVDLRNKN